MKCSFIVLVFLWLTSNLVIFSDILGRQDKFFIQWREVGIVSIPIFGQDDPLQDSNSRLCELGSVTTMLWAQQYKLFVAACRHRSAEANFDTAALTLSVIQFHTKAEFMFPKFASAEAMFNTCISHNLDYCKFIFNPLKYLYFAHFQFVNLCQTNIRSSTMILNSKIKWQIAIRKLLVH